MLSHFQSLSDAEEELRQVMNLFNIKNNNLLKHSYKDMIHEVHSHQILKRFTTNKDDRKVSDSYQSITRSKHQIKQATSRLNKEDKKVSDSYHRVTSRNKKASSKSITPTTDKDYQKVLDLYPSTVISTSTPIDVFRRSFAGSNSIFLDNHSFESPDLLGPTKATQKVSRKGLSPRVSRGLIRTWSNLVQSESVMKILQNDSSNDSLWLQRVSSKGVLKRKSHVVKSVVAMPPAQNRDADEEYMGSEISWSDIVKHQFKEAVSNRISKRLDDYY